AKLEGVLLEEMAPKNGIETILGAKKNSNLGTTIMFGMGGVYVEVLKDVSFGIVPITPQDAKRMVESLKASKIFAGFRGMPCYDVNAVINCLGRLSQLLTDFPEIKELDINPLLVLPKGEGVRVLDARIIIE
ncbi:acyl-CoA synthetase, partial [Candidatus Shapirobacteria bacterium CG07_land_8_20_14_0_80_39_18]